MSDTRTDDEIAELFAAADPVRPGFPASDPIELVPTIPSHGDRDSVGGDPVLVPADHRNRERWPLVGLVAAAVALVVSLLVTSIRDDRESVPADQPVPTPTLAEPDGTEPVEANTAPESDQVDVATVFWQALAAGDREAALSVVEPASRDSEEVVPFGYADTLEELFAWQAVVGWQTALEECVVGEGTYPVDCTVTVSNAWSDALGVEPIIGKFAMEFGDSGITRVTARSAFSSRYGPEVFEVFRQWVRTNHPEDARLMWESADHENFSEILSLFRINTERFVESHQDASGGPVVDTADLVEEAPEQHAPGTSDGG